MRARCCTTTESLERALLSAKLNREYSKKLGRGLVTRLLPIEQTVWSKTILITRGVGGTGVYPPSCKMDTYFLRSLDLSEPIYRNFHLNGAKWPSLKLWKNILYIIGYYIIFYTKFETWPFTSIWLEISIKWHTKRQGLKKKCTRFTKGRIYPCPAHSACN